MSYTDYVVMTTGTATDNWRGGVTFHSDLADAAQCSEQVEGQLFERVTKDSDVTMKLMDLSQYFYTAQPLEDDSLFFYMVANGDALFTRKKKEAFKCEGLDDARELADAMNETDPDHYWRAVLVKA